MRRLTLGPAKAACTYSASQSSQLLAGCTSIVSSMAWVIEWYPRKGTARSKATHCSAYGHLLGLSSCSTLPPGMNLANPTVPGMVPKLLLGWLQAWPAAWFDKARPSELSLATKYILLAPFA